MPNHHPNLHNLTCLCAIWMSHYVLHCHWMLALEINSVLQNPYVGREAREGHMKVSLLTGWWLKETSEQEFYSPVAHGDHPNQEYQRYLIDPLSHYSHPLPSNQARRLLQGGPEQYSTVKVVKYNCRVLEVTIMTSLTLLDNDKEIMLYSVHSFRPILHQ